MCCQVLLEHVLSCDIMIMSSSHRLGQVISGVQCIQHWHVWNLSLRLSMAIVRSPVIQWHIRTEATHGHTIHGVQVSVQMSNKYFILKVFVFTSFRLCQQLTSHQSHGNQYIYPATMWWQVIFRRSDMRSGDFASKCRGRLSSGTLQVHTPWVSIWVPTRATYRPTA